MIEKTLPFRFLMIAFALMLFIIACIQLYNMPKDAFPEFAPPYIQVQTEAPGLSDAEVEELVTFNLEELLNGTPWLKFIRSTSVHGLSSIVLYFQPDTDIMKARQMVSERLGLAYALPNVAQAPIILQPLSAMSRVMMVGVTSKQLSLIEMSVLARWVIRPALLSVPGIANVAIWGMRDKQLQVLVDPFLLQKNNIKLDQIIATTGDALWVSPLSFLKSSTPGSGGWIDTPLQRIEIRHVLPIKSAGDLGQVNIEGSSLTLNKVATLTNGHQPLIGDALVDGQTGLLIVIDKFRSANTLDVTRKVETKLNELKPGLTGMQFDTQLFKPADFIKIILDNTVLALLLGLVILILLLMIFLNTWRAMLMILINIFVSLSIAVLVLTFFKFTMNMMVIAGFMMALVILIDESIFNLDIYNRNYVSMIYSLIIILIALIPICFLHGISLDFFKPLGITFAIVMISSMITSLFISPSFYSLLSPNMKITQSKSNMINYLHNHYKKMLEWFIQTISSYLFIIIVCILGLIVLATMTWKLLFYESLPYPVPMLKEPNIIIKWDGPSGTSINEMARITGLALNELKNIPGIKKVSADIGRAILGDQVVNVNVAEIIVSVDLTKNYEIILNSIQKVLENYPGIYHHVETYLKERILNVITGSSGDIIIRVFGPELNTLFKIAENIKYTLNKIGITAYIEQERVQPQIEIEVNLNKSKQYGLKPGDVRRASATIIAGLETGSLFEEQKIFPSVVWGVPETRNSVNSVNNLLLDTPNGKWVHLKDVADVTIKSVPSLIKHDNVSRCIDIIINLHGKSASAYVKKIKEGLKAFQFPLEYRAEIIGIHAQEKMLETKLLVISIASAILIFLFLQAAFASFTLAASVFMTIPLALLGSFIMMPVISNLSFASLFALLVVFAIAIRHTVFLIQFYQTENCNVKNIKFIPILITTFTSIVVLLPFVLFNGMAGLEIVSTMTIIIISGLISSAIYTLFIVPSLFLLFGSSSKSGENDA